MADVNRGQRVESPACAPSVHTVCALRWFALALVLLAACERTHAPPAPIECPPFNPLPLDRLTVEGAREAFRRAELRRHLRFQEAITPGYTVRLTREMAPQDAISARQVCFADLYEAGRILFEHEYSYADGLGGGDASKRADSPFRRVQRGAFGGPETQSCASCHWRGGPAGAGALQDNAFIQGDGDWVATGDPRNPPPLHGAGVVQALAQEMSAELAAARTSAIGQALADGKPVEIKLSSKGVEFGVLRVSANGQVDSSGIEGIDPDLVIKPFGWKGNFATIRDFVAESLHVHFNIQSAELIDQHRQRRNHSLVGRGRNINDPDNDGFIDELTHGQQTALVAYLAALEMPVVAVPDILHGAEAAAENLAPPSPIRFSDEWARGRQLFDELGCGSCHKPFLVLSNPRFVTRTHDGRTYSFDLSTDAEEPRVTYDARLGGYPVWLFSDLKRHDMGRSNMTRYKDRGVAKREFMTRRLWGLAQSGPYFYDGRAPTVDYAIMAHDGEAEYARDNFAELDHQTKGALRVYLMSMRREPRLVIP